VPVLDLVRGVKVVVDDDAVRVVVEDHRRLGNGFVAELLPDPVNPVQRWRREHVRRTGTDYRGRRTGHYVLASAGVFEARSVYRANKLGVTYFVVEGGVVEVIGHKGDELQVLAHVNGIDTDALAGLREIQEKEEHPQALPPLTGTPRQVQWATDLRARRMAEAARDPSLLGELSRVEAAAWFIVTRNDSLERLRERLGAPSWTAARDALAQPPPGDDDPPW
jgi:hypothetical protein